MRVLVVGGRGAAGSRVAAEAVRRGHEVTIASRAASAGPDRQLDASDVEAVTAAAREVDVVVAATRPEVGREADVEGVAAALATAAGRTGARLLVVGGAAPLRVPGTDSIARDDPAFVPAAYRAIASASARQLEVLVGAGRGADWTYVAPAADFRPGETRGRYRRHVGGLTGADLVITADGTSRISMEDFALAVLDEIEEPSASRQVIAVGW